MTIIIMMAIYFTIGGLMLLSGINNSKENVNIGWCIGALLAGLLWPLAIILTMLIQRRTEAK